jgi:hypothetical protein
MFLGNFQITYKMIFGGIIALVSIYLLIKFFRGTKHQGKWVTVFEYAGLDPPNPLVVARPIMQKYFFKDGWLEENNKSTRGLGQ